MGLAQWAQIFSGNPVFFDIFAMQRELAQLR
jgi:hypothetical protein